MIGLGKTHFSSHCNLGVVAIPPPVLCGDSHTKTLAILLRGRKREPRGQNVIKIGLIFWSNEHY